MIFGSNVQWLASAMLDRMVFCLAEGTVFALFVSLLLRLKLGRNSRTRFVMWFSALLATALLPLLVVRWPGTPSTRLEQNAVTIPASVVTYLLEAWFLIAFAGIIRVLAGFWQVHRTRIECKELEPELLHSSVMAHVEAFRSTRRLKLLISERMQVPAAIGFFQPAIIIPRWMIQEASAEELEHVVLHELAHLQRRDDWTNLAQKVVKALLFFHPAVWWIERRLAVDRELACDDEVLRRTANPRSYAESLTRIAQKSFLRRQLALAQAALGKFVPLSFRVKRILNSDGREAGKVWRPAVPVVVALAMLSGVGVSWTPDLVKVQGPTASESSVARNQAASRLFVPASAGMQLTAAPSWNAGLRNPARRGALSGPRVNLEQHQSSLPKSTAARAVQNTPRPTVLQARRTQPEPEKDFVLLIATERQVMATPGGLEVKISQVRLLIPASEFQKQAQRKI
jgi:beta-lactamase regulating signal transducer with metallopeptidase domain